MRILFFDNQLPELLKSGITGGGACIRLYALIKGLSTLNQKIGVITWKGAKAYIDKPLDFEILDSYPRNGGIRFIKPIFPNFFLIHKAARRFNADVLIIKGCGLYTGILAFSAVLLKLPVVFMITNNKDVDDRYRDGLDLLAQISYRFALKVSIGFICQNEYQLSSLKKAYPAKKFLLIYNPFYSDYALPEIKPSSQRQYIAWIGVFSDQKNLPALLEIVKSKPDLMFHIAGQINSYKQAGEDTVTAVNELQNTKNVKMVGFLNREEVMPFLSEAKLLLNTSHYEGFSNTFLEAFAVGTPVVTRRSVDPDSIIERNGLGRVVESYDELPEAISYLQNLETYDQLAEQCRSYLNQNHGKEQIAAHLLKFMSALSRNTIS